MQQYKLFNKTKSLWKAILFGFVLFGIIIIPTGCNKLVDARPPNNSLNGANLYTSDATAIAVMTGLYTYMSAPTFPFATGVNSISVQCGLSADELSLYSGSTNLNYIAQYRNDLSNQVCPPFWGNFYYFLHTINSALEGVSNSNSLTVTVKQQLQGEAKFMRAFCHFYLLNLYGDIPLITTSNYADNATLPRTSKDKVWQQIIADLKDAQTLLSTGYVNASLLGTTTERVRPNKWAATALLARAYLYSGDYLNAEAQASAIINNSSQYSLSPLTGSNNVFTKNSSEAIWQLQPVNSGWNTEDARVFVLPTSGPNSSTNQVYLSPSILAAFETGDQRKTIGNWVNTDTVGTTVYWYSYKYKRATLNAPVTEYLMILRLAEQYLIRAEARAKQNNLSGAASDLNMIRNRAGLPNIDNTTANSQSLLLNAILHERQVELFTEWGHRWLDLKRTGNVDAIMNSIAPLKGGNWQSYKQLYPIPLHEIQTDPNLVQNMGY